MPRPTKSDRLNAVHREALLEFDQIQSSVRDERKQCLEDRRFYSIAGAQWEGAFSELFGDKPKIEVNKIHLAIIRIINEYRNNRITVDFKAKGSSRADDELADVCDGLYRATEQDSSAEEAYDNAFEEAVGGGFGAFRLRTQYEDEEDPEDESQRICIEPIYDADTCVFFDLNAKKQDKSDATKCYVLTSMTLEAYKETYDDDPTTWPKEIGGWEFDWCDDSVIYVAEYYKIETKSQTISIWQMLDRTEQRFTEEELETKSAELIATGAKQVRTKKIKVKRVHKYILSGNGILEDCGYLVGKHIPIVPVYGKRWYVDNIERCMGHVRLAKDVARLKNMQLSKLAEISAAGSVEKPIFTPEQMAGHQDMWSKDNIKDYPYLLINPITNINGDELPAGPLGYTKSPAIPPALAALLQITEDDMQDLLGNQQEGEQMVNNVAERTIELIQSRLDMQTYIYVSNMAKAIKRAGEVWLDMAKDTYVEEGREMETVGLQGEREMIALIKPMIDSDTGEKTYANDLSRAKFKVLVDVGPSSSTKRQATVRNVLRLAAVTEDPETKQVLISMAMMNMEGEGISDMREYFRQKLIKMGAVEPTDQEAKDLAEEQKNTPPSPQDEYLKAAAMREQTESEKNQVETIREQAEADKVRAQTQEILSKLDLDKLNAMVAIIEKLGPRVIPEGVS